MTGNAIALRVDVRGDFAQGAHGYFFRSAIHIFQIALRIQIVHRDSRARHDVVEVIKQQILPGQFHSILRVRAPVERGKGCELFRIQYCFFGSADSALGFGLSRENSAMISEVEFAIPGRNLHVWEVSSPCR